MDVGPRHEWPGFLLDVTQELVPTLKKDDIVIMDNLGSYKITGVREAIEVFGAGVLYLPSYSPDLNSIVPKLMRLAA